MTADTQAQGDLIKLARELSFSMKHSAGQWMVPGWDGYKVSELLDKLAAALQGRGTQEGEPSDERAAFEAEFRPRYPDPVDWEQAIRRAPGTPNNYELQAAWHAWQARAVLAQAQKERNHG